MGLKGLVSFSLFGNRPLYNIGAIKNAEIWQASPFDVDCRFYIGNSVPDWIPTELLDLGCEVIHMLPYPEDQTATFWRWDAFRVPRNSYDYVLSRDVDSRPFEREYYAISEWLESKYPIHVIRDHPYHGVPILAGLFGVKGSTHIEWFGGMCPTVPPQNFYLEINQKYNRQYESNDFYQVDQHWLRRKVYPHLRNKILAHDEFYGFERKRYKKSFPEQSDLDMRFCGEGFNENDEPRYPEHRDVIKMWPRRR